MSNPSPLSDEERDELVAYLDGELDEEKSRAVEARISLNPTVRAEAEALRQTWELLDFLPRPGPSPDFTNRTLDRLSVLQSRADVPRRPHPRRWPLAAGWAAAVLLAGLLGYAAMIRTVPPTPTEADLVRDLRLIENLRYYEPVERIEFLKELDHRGLFGEDERDS